MRLLSEFLRSPGEFFQDERRQRILIIFLFSLIFVCVLLTMIRSTARQSIPSDNSDASPTRALPEATNTKWWVRKDPSSTQTSNQNLLFLIGTLTLTPISEKCPPYTVDFKQGTYGYISLSPSYENLIRSGAGENYSSVGYIEAGDWVKILDVPICANDGYVWLNVQSAGSSSSWTAGGLRDAQWVIPCSDPNKRCTRKEETRLPTSTPEPDGSGQADRCVSERLAIGLDAQVSPADLLAVRVEPYTGGVLGHIPPAAFVKVIEGPKCEGGAIWWRVTSPETSGWCVENLLKPCSKEGACKPWE